MLRRVTVAAALVVGGLAVVPSTVASADDADYADPRFASATTVSVEGELVEVVSDDFADHGASHSYVVAVDDGPTVAVSFADEVTPGRFDGELVVDRATARRADLAAGQDVDGDSSRGERVLADTADADAPTPVASASITPAAAFAATPNAHRAYVAVMNNAAPTATAVTDALSYWTTEAGGAITSFSVVQQSKFSSTAADCGMASSSSAAEAWNAAAATFPGVSFDGGSGNHLVVMVPSSCKFVGLGTLGTSGLAAGGKVLVNSGSSTATQTAVHELGHNFGLDHANLDGCSCEYHDLYSPMGLGVGTNGTPFTPPALGTLYRHELDVATSDEVTTVEPSGDPQTFTLSPRGSSSGRRGLLVTDPTDGEQYSIDWRSRTGRDTGAFYGGSGTISGLPRYDAGIVVERQDGAADTYLESRTSGTTTFGSFVAGTRFVASSGLTVTVVSIGPTTATVTVSFPGFAPVDPDLPTIVGTVAVGRTVWAGPGEWPAGTSDPTYAWTVDGVDVPGATSDVLVIPASAAGGLLRVEVTATPPGGNPLTLTSAATAVSPGTYAPGTAGVSGVPQVGRTLTAVTTMWPSDATLSYAWVVGGTTVGTARSLVVPPVAGGRSLVLRVRADRAGYADVAPVSTVPRAVAWGSLVTSAPKISGRAKVGQTLAAVPGTWGPKGVAVTYQWFANGKAITGAVYSGYKVPSSLVGRRVTVRATGRLTGYTTVARFSAATAAIAK